MNLKSLTNLLETNVREELQAKRAILALIEQQENAVAKSDADVFDTALEAAKQSVEADARRTRRRDVLMAKMAELWQVTAEALTLGSIASRLGKDGEALATLRQELREVVAEVIKRNRRLSALLGMHRRLNRDILQVVLGAEDGAEPTRAGTLVNAQA